MTPDLQVALAIAFLMGLILGFAVGYGVRAFISHRRHVAARGGRSRACRGFARQIAGCRKQLVRIAKPVASGGLLPSSQTAEKAAEGHVCA
jgi:hypothetical protein